MPFLSLLTGPLGKVAGIAFAVLSLLAVGLTALHQHDARVVAEVAAQEQAAALKTLQADHAKAVAALQDQLAVAQAQAQRTAQLKDTIANAPHTSACATSPAVRAALDGLRKQSPSGR